MIKYVTLPASTMPSPNKHKISPSHSTDTEASREVMRLINKLPEVTKISLGEIRHVPGGRRDIKFLPMNGGVKVVVRGNGAVQHMYVYTKDVEKVIQHITKGFEVSPK